MCIRDSYSLSGTVATGLASITPKVLQVTGTAVADKMEDGDASAKVTMGSLTGLVGQEQLQATVSGSFRSASVGTDQPVDVLYSLQDGAGGGKAGNYAVPVQVLKASILPMPRSNPIQPVLAPEKPLSSGNKVVFAAQPAMATRPTQGKNESRQECSILNPEKCECQDTAVQGLQLCVMPVEAVSSRTGEQLSSIRVPSLP